MASTPAQRPKTQLYVPPGTSVEESRRIRKQHWESKFRNRGGIYKPSPTNKLADILLARAINGESPSKASRRPVTPTRDPSPTPEAGPSSRTLEEAPPEVAPAPKSKTTTRKKAEGTTKKRAPTKKAAKVKPAASSKDTTDSAPETSRKRKAAPEEHGTKATNKRAVAAKSSKQDNKDSADEVIDPLLTKSQKLKGKQKAIEDVEPPAEPSGPPAQVAVSKSRNTKQKPSETGEGSKPRRTRSKKIIYSDDEGEDDATRAPELTAEPIKATPPSTTEVDDDQQKSKPRKTKDDASRAGKRKLDTIVEDDEVENAGDEPSSPSLKKRKKQEEPLVVAEKKAPPTRSKSKAKDKDKKDVEPEGHPHSSNSKKQERQENNESSTTREVPPSKSKKARPKAGLTKSENPVDDLTSKIEESLANEVLSDMEGGPVEGKAKRGTNPKEAPAKATKSAVKQPKAKAAKKTAEGPRADQASKSVTEVPAVVEDGAEPIRVVIKQESKDTVKLGAAASKPSKPPSSKAQQKPRSKPKMSGPPKSVLDRIRANAEVVEVIDAADELDLFTWASPAKKKQ